MSLNGNFYTTTNPPSDGGPLPWYVKALGTFVFALMVAGFVLWAAGVFVVRTLWRTTRAPKK
jgi:hypothetical protein